MADVAIVTRPRYVVLVWMYNHWGVTFTTDNLDEAYGVRAQAEKKLPAAIVVDTEGEQP